jgi:hypothetical protein
LAVTGVDFTPADKDEMLRHFLLVSKMECILVEKYSSVFEEAHLLISLLYFTELG